MAIRVSGLISGLDTDSIVQELVSAYSTKKDKYVKKQTKLDWKMDAWKDLNKKVNSLYKKLGNLKFSSAYVKKSTTCSDTTKATVSASGSAINGTQSLKILQTAKTGYITGAKLADSVSSATKLSELGLDGDASVAVTVGGAAKNITLTKDMTVKEAATALQGAGISVNYDEVNKRMFVSAKESGVANDFALTATDANGIKALQGLGIYVNKASNQDAYKAWTAYAVDAAGNPAYDSDGNLVGTIDEAATEANLKNILETIQKYQGDATVGDSADRANSSIAFLQQDSATRKTENTNLLNKINYATSYRELRECVKGPVQKDAEGNPVKDADGKVVRTQTLDDTEQARLAELMTKGELTEDEQTEFDALKTKLGADENEWKTMEGYAATVKKFDAYLLNDTLTTAERDELQAVQNNVKNAYTTGNGAADINSLVGEPIKDTDGNITGYTGGWMKDMAANNDEINANTEAIAEKNAYIKSYAILTNAAPASDTATIDSRVQVLMDKIEFANQQLTSGPAGGYSAAQQVAAQDAKIELNGVEYTSASSNITVNGLTITALQTTDPGEELSVTTSANAQGIYDTIKDFLKQYNELIKEMDKLYNASSSKGYEPLTDDEKEAMSDKEVEKWEEKIKDSILRRDDTLSSVMNTMTMAMSKSFKLSDGKTYSLASFGIKTQGYLSAEENEGSVYHIDGDADDEISSGNTDKLLAAIQKDPEGVQEFFQQLTGNFYQQLDDKMKSSTFNHSAFTIYNDKTMQKEYDEYTKTIKKWEEKVSDMEDYYYKKFSAMETALSKLQQSTSALSGLLGTS